MKRLFYTFFILVIFSCGLSEEQVKEHERQYETYFEFADNNGQFFRISIAIEMVESPNSYFKKTYYQNVLKIDSLLKTSYYLIDSAITSPNNYLFEEAQTMYDSTFSFINSKFNKEEDGLKELYLPPYKSDFEKLNISENKLMLIQMKIDLAISYCSYMELLYDLLKGGCSGFGVSPNLKSSSTVDSSGTVIINLTDEAMQLSKEGRHIIIEEVKKNGSSINPKYSSTNDYTFANIRLDSLEKGNYQIKGKVRYYTVKGIKDYMFKEEIKVK
ncbi:MAG: hypothetical protein RQ875_08860 [Vicingaceae bacterium]|nr:hypothetical protein [Vicingaceae bacterium]